MKVGTLNHGAYSQTKYDTILIQLIADHFLSICFLLCHMPENNYDHAFPKLDGLMGRAVLALQGLGINWTQQQVHVSKRGSCLHAGLSNPFPDSLLNLTV